MSDAVIIMRDQIHDLKPNTKYILNLDTSLGSGTHWTSFFINGKSLTYFDSFGMPPPQELVDYASKHKLSIKWNKIQYQDDQSTACGYFAMYAVKSMSDGTYPKSLKVFNKGSSTVRNELALGSRPRPISESTNLERSKDLITNDNIVKSYF